MKRIVLTVAVIVVVMISLIIIPPIAMDLPANVADETQSIFAQQSGSNNTVEQNDNTKGKDTVNKPGIVVSVEAATGKKGSTITVPINFKDVAKVESIGTCNFYLNYDTNVLKAESVKSGDIVASPETNFSSNINLESGKISLLFLDDTVGSELIKKDGIFATITFTIIGSSGTESAIKFADGGAFGNGEMKKVENVTRADGSVKVK